MSGSSNVPPKSLAKEYEISLVLENGDKIKFFEETENKKRNILLPIETAVKEISLTILKNWGEEAYTKLFTFECFH